MIRGGLDIVTDKTKKKKKTGTARGYNRALKITAVRILPLRKNQKEIYFAHIKKTISTF